MDINKILNERYSTKNFDPTKKISDDDFKKIKALLKMSPSSTNLQPWHFVIARTENGKKRMTKGTQGFFKFNELKVLNASVVVIFCARTQVNKDYMKLISESEGRDGRYPSAEVKQNIFNARNMFADIHKYELKDLQHWLEKQVYLNVGNFLLGVACIGLDAVPMEGVDLKELDKEFGLREKGYTSVLAVSVGYRAGDDFNAPSRTPKSRLTAGEIFTVLD